MPFIFAIIYSSLYALTQVTLDASLSLLES